MSARPLDARLVIDVTAAYYRIDREAITDGGRQRPAVEARWVAMWIIREHTELSAAQIGRLFDQRDHSTVFHALKKTRAILETQPTVRARHHEIEAEVLRQHDAS